MEGDVLPKERRHMLEVGVVDRVARQPKMRDRIHHIARIPHHNRIDDQTHAGRPIQLTEVIALAEQPLLAKEHLAGQRMEQLALIERVVNAPTVLLVADVIECGERLEDPPKFLNTCLGTALLFETLQLADQQLCCDRPVLKRGRNPVHLLPIVTDAATIDSGAAKEYSELALALLTCHWVEHLR